MSQFPPIQPPQQFPNPGPYAYPPARRGNGAAVASLVFGLLGCIPLLAGLLAVIFSIIGMRKTRDPNVGGKGLAIAGLILGMVSLMIWGAGGGFFAFTYVQSKPARTVARMYLQDLSDGNVTAAMANSQDVDAGDLQKMSDYIQQEGKLQDITFASFNVEVENGQTTWRLAGVANLGGKPKKCSFVLVKVGDSYKMTSVHID